MVKGIINAFDHLELCLVINLTMCGTGLLYSHRYLLLGILVLLLPFIPGSKYLFNASSKKKKIIISDTDFAQKTDKLQKSFPVFLYNLCIP